MTGSGPPDSLSMPYRLRESRRARRVLLRVLPEGMVEVVVPPGFDPGHIPPILCKHEDWIARMRELLQAREALVQREPIPKTIDLRAIGHRVLVQSVASESPMLLLSHPSPTRIRIEGDLEDTEDIRILLKRWLRHEAQQHLIPWLRQTSADLGLPFGRAQVRGQRTRWASCSARGTISLNERLLFLPPELVRYVFAHELCHTVHLSHSSAFWALLQRFEPDWPALDARTREAERFIPPWVF